MPKAGIGELQFKNIPLIKNMLVANFCRLGLARQLFDDFCDMGLAE